jgi:putative membrane protein
MLETSWTLDPLPVASVAVAGVLYLQAFARLRRRGARTHARMVNLALSGAGLAVILMALISPIDAVAEDQLLAAHMLQHLLLGDLGPLLLVLGVRGPIAVFLLPARLLRPVARGPLRGLAGVLLRPRVSIGLWLAVLGGWHLPAAYDAALAQPALHVFEHVCFLSAGLLAWTQIVDPARRRRLSVGLRALFAFVMLVASGVLAEVLVASHPLYAYYLHVPGRPFDWTAAEDQSRAALLMMAEQIATLATAMTFLIRAHVKRVAPEVPGYRQP